SLRGCPFFLNDSRCYSAGIACGIIEASSTAQAIRLLARYSAGIACGIIEARKAASFSRSSLMLLRRDRLRHH
ncbi:hypothetical protein, partial [Alicyclobacillus acidiphilus]|uniref:hypothetical protein n=1 Tax=Alicyclobacillus acidiphilus TaxID=182455 RepID=UPI001C3F2DD9